ncbi:MAG: BrnT family toxin [Alphaproteobacteria bacterium]|nr:BrnT family toxin [Alphaproteobacteria bacterium]MCW5742592.1 BrnT family toxin [Alphaproteobacteria bacterium]
MGRVVVNGQCYEWDDEKRRRTLRKHGVDFVDLPAALEAAAIFGEDLDHSTDEDRWRALTPCRGRVVMVVYTWRQDCARLITARHATPAETARYLQRS